MTFEDETKSTQEAEEPRPCRGQERSGVQERTHFNAYCAQSYAESIYDVS